MGWTWYQADYYKNGKVYRKAECDKMMNTDMVSYSSNEKIGKYEVLKSTMVGATYYAAVRKTKFATELEPEISSVFAVIFLTSTNEKDYYNFGYKDMEESMAPAQCSCPKGILDLLSPTDNKFAIQWREACRKNLEKKNSPTALNKLPIGTQIEWTNPYSNLTSGMSKGETKILIKKASWNRGRPYWSDGYYKYPTKLIGESYTVLRSDD